MKTRVLKILSNNDINKISKKVSSWRKGKTYKDETGFCKSSTIDEIEKNNFILTPGRYVGFSDDNDEIDYNKKNLELIKKLEILQTNNKKIEEDIKINLKKIIKQ